MIKTIKWVQNEGGIADKVTLAGCIMTGVAGIIGVASCIYACIIL